MDVEERVEELTYSGSTPLLDRLRGGEDVQPQELAEYIAALEKRVAAGEYGPGDRIG